MGRGKKIAKNYVVNKWQNPFHYIVSPLCLTSYQCPKHNIYICILCFKGPPTTSSFMAMPTVNETTSWSVSFSSEAPARSAGPLSHPGLTSTKLAKGGAQHFSFYFPSELNLATLLWPLSVYIITFIYIYIYEHLEMTLSASTYIDKRALFNFQTSICGIWICLSIIYLSIVRDYGYTDKHKNV